MKNTFRGGVHPHGWKELSREEPLREVRPSGEMVFPLQQHIGRPAVPVVKKNDRVLVGQRLAEASGMVSAHIYSSCSGKVKAIEKRRMLTGAMLESVVVENDGLFECVEGFGEPEDVSSIDNEELIRRVQEAGIIGQGGAGFPTHVKLRPKDPKAIRYVIANGAECEPYLTCNDQLMRTCAPEIIEGLELVLRLFPNAEGVIGIEDNKPEAIEAMRRAASGRSRIRVQALKTKYPQGGEHSLITVIAGLDYPVSMLPADVGCIVDNVGTLRAIRRAVVLREPAFTQCFTLTGDAVKHPGNYIVRDGMSFAELLEIAGGLRDGAVPVKALAGGPMMGIALSSLDVPIQKMNNGLTIMTEDPCETAQRGMTACLHCGRCTTVCPVGLLPQLLADAAIDGDLKRFEKKLYGMECVQCGSCTYVCPAKRPLMQTFKQARAEILAERRRQGGAK